MESDESILKRAERFYKKTEKYIKTDEVICACYLYKAFRDEDMKSFKRFKEIFNKLDDKKKQKALNYYLAYTKSVKETKRKNK